MVSFRSGSGVFEGFDLVAELGGAFVGFIFDGAGELLAEFVEFGLAQADGILLARTGLRFLDGLAGVVVGTVLGTFDDAAELVKEEVVILGTAEETGILEFLPGHAAVGTAGDGGIADLGVGLEELIEEFVDGDVSLLDVTGFLCTGVAKVDIVGLAAGDFRHVDGGGLVASFTEMHGVSLVKAPAGGATASESGVGRRQS